MFVLVVVLVMLVLLAGRPLGTSRAPPERVVEALVEGTVPGVVVGKSGRVECRHGA